MVDETCIENEKLDKQPALADLVLAGEGQHQVIDLGNGIYMAQCISNLYLITSSEGDVLINTGFPGSAQRNKELMDRVRKGPLRYIVLTQAHADHYGGVSSQKEPDTLVAAQRNFSDTCKFFDDLNPYFMKRLEKLWGTIINSDGVELPEVIPDIVVDDEFSFKIGDRLFELISTPGGESLCSLCVWLPQDRTVFTGNLFGPFFLSMPFLSTIRGDKPRSVKRYLRSLKRVRDLDAETLITGHGQPIRGAEKIRSGLDRMYSAVSYLDDAVIKGMNAGKDVFTLMDEIKLPEDIAIAELHGNVRWAVRSIYHEYTGWFRYDSTTSLYAVPRSSVDVDIVKMAGGSKSVAEQAEQNLLDGKILQALHLLDIALGAEPSCQTALSVKKQSLEALLKNCENQNLSETMWLRSEIGMVTDRLAKA